MPENLNPATSEVGYVPQQNDVRPKSNKNKKLFIFGILFLALITTGIIAILIIVNFNNKPNVVNQTAERNVLYKDLKTELNKAFE